MYFRVFLFYVPFLFLSCIKAPKEKNVLTIAEGTVYDQYTGKPIPNCVVRLCVTDNINTFSNSIVTDSMVSSNEGKFNFTISRTPIYPWTYYISPRVPQYKDKPYLGYFIQMGKKNENMQVKILPYGYAKVDVINVPPLDTFAEYTLNFIPKNSLGPLYKDTTFLIRTIATDSVVIQFHLMRFKGDYGDYRNLITYIHPFDTVRLTFNY